MKSPVRRIGVEGKKGRKADWSRTVPELPEVETIRRGLEAQIHGRSIASTAVLANRVFQVDPEWLRTEIAGQTIVALDRRGKYLILELEDWYWIIHLGMTGQLTVRSPDPAHTGPDSLPELDRHTPFVTRFTSGEQMTFRDVRKFGRVFLIPRTQQEFSDFFRRLGLEPFGSSYRLKDFLRKLRGRKTRIKSMLLNQGFVAGVGNIYADEALFASGIHPARTVRSLRLAEQEALFHAIPKVLEHGMRYGGTTLRDYVGSDGEPGQNQNGLRVYGRNDRHCYRCSTVIQKTVIGQRGTHFCPSCQPRNGKRRS